MNLFRLFLKVLRLLGFHIHSVTEVARLGRTYILFPPMYNKWHTKYFEVYLPDIFFIA